MFLLAGHRPRHDRRDRPARSLCQKLLTYASPLLLYAEEIDTSSGEHLWNFPQAFTDLALIEAVSRLIEAERHRRGVPGAVVARRQIARFDRDPIAAHAGEEGYV